MVLHESWYVLRQDIMGRGSGLSKNLEVATSSSRI